MLLNELPEELLGLIFQNLDLPTRGKCAQVCKRFLDICTCRAYSMPDVVVMNLFERSVWLNCLSPDGAGSKLRCIPLRDPALLNSILTHVTQCNSVKLWFKSETFVRTMLSALKAEKFRLKCLDIYPYSEEAPLEVIEEFFPDICALTLRPHGSDHFWDGLSLTKFPAFKTLQTLVLDSVNLGKDVQLPDSLTQLEWTNRRETRFAEFMPKITELPNLEYLLIGHANFTETGLLTKFYEIISQLNKLQFIVFRFVKFPTDPLGWADAEVRVCQPFAKIKVLKFDLCYGNLSLTLSQFMDITARENLKIVGLNCIYEDFTLQELYSVVPQLSSRKISLQFGLLQKNPGKLVRPSSLQNQGSSKENDDDAKFKLPLPPLELKDVLWKLDMSFLEDQELLMVLLSAGTYWMFTDLKLIQCPAVTDEFLEMVARHCPRIRKAHISSCERVSSTGINHFLRDWSVRKSANLFLQWKGKDHPAAYYLHLLKDKTKLLDGKRSKFVPKKLAGEVNAERILIYDRQPKDGPMSERKSMTIQDYGDCESHWILGFAIPVPEV